MLSDVKFRHVDFAGDFGQFGGACTEEDWRICLGNAERTDDPEDSGEDGHHTLDPSPPRCLGEEATCDGSYIRVSILQSEKTRVHVSPSDGPKKGAAANMAVAIPLSDWLNISAITPPELVSGELPSAPAKKRRTTRAGKFGAPAPPALKATKPA